MTDERPAHLLPKLFRVPCGNVVDGANDVAFGQPAIAEWRLGLEPGYDETFLIAPPAEDAEVEPEEGASEQDPMYDEALRVVLEMGKASTSTLQRRLRLGYGRAARILDMMHKDGIIGPPDGSKPREVLKRADWLREADTVK